jgi:hypothetical protein
MEDEMMTQVSGETIYTQEEIDNAVPEHDKIETAYFALTPNEKSIIKDAIGNLYESGVCSFVPLVCGFMASNGLLVSRENLEMAYNMLCEAK